MPPHPDTLLRTMVRPKWIVALVFALALAAGFALLGQWQLQRAIDSGTVVEEPTETPVALTKAATPSGPIRTSRVGQLVTTQGEFRPGDYSLLYGRQNNGPTGYWVVGRFTLTETSKTGKPIELAVARGWAANHEDAARAASTLARQPQHVQTLTGRLLPTEAPEQPAIGTNPRAMKDMSVAALFNIWHGVDHSVVYEAYVVEHGTIPAGLTQIYSPPPIEQATIDWLNVFYAAEWAIFAGFAIFLWYRVVRDSWEKEQEDAAAAREAVAIAAAAPPEQASSGRTPTKKVD